MKLSLFDFALPEDLIAQRPAPERDLARLMVIRRNSGQIEHRVFRELPDLLEPQHFLVLNTTRVFPARFWARRPGKQERIEILLTQEKAPGKWNALVRPARKATVGQCLETGHLLAQVRQALPNGMREIEFAETEDLAGKLEKSGAPPLPPYIRRDADYDPGEDRDRYQTVFARQSGSIAAPTAGLHFTPAVLRRLTEKGIPLCEILLHVGYGTFQPVRCEDVEDHTMEPEYFEVPEAAAACISRHRNQGKTLIAVGTTATRVLEHLARRESSIETGSCGYCDLFIYPGFDFRVLGGLLTNFHLPQSTLFMLVCAFAGREFMLDCYREAIAQRYRFFSYGDCMLIL